MNLVRALGVVSIIAAVIGGLMYAQTKNRTVLDSLVQDGYTVNRVVIDDTNGNAAIYLRKRGN